MITCERCNTQNLDGSQYCDECGSLLSVSLRTKKPDTEPTEGGNGSVGAMGSMTENSSGVQAESFSANRSELAASSRQSAAFMTSPDSVSVNGPHAKLVIHRGRSVGKEFPLSGDDEAQIGRWDADGGIFPDVDLDADDPEAKVSRRHARITRRGEQYYIEDLGSTNGTFINRGRRLLPGDRQPLHDGDEVIVGKTFLRFQVIK